jgi:DNA-binding GntR family transcriptional regulator
LENDFQQPDSGLGPLPLTSRVNTAVEALTQAIFSGFLQPGDPLPERQLAARLGVSQPTIREALVELDHVGLVDRILHKGTQVKNLTRREVAERIQVRIPLDGQASVAASRVMTESDFDELRRLVQGIADRSLVDADARFHRHIWRLSPNRTQFDALNALCSPLFAFVVIMRRATLHQLATRVDSHYSLIAALHSRNPDLILRRVTDHVLGAYRDFLNSDYPDCRSLAQHSGGDLSKSNIASYLQTTIQNLQDLDNYIEVLHQRHSSTETRVGRTTVTTTPLASAAGI